MDRAARVGRWLDDRGAWLLATLFVLVVVGRVYHRLVHPQFWAEDGSTPHDSLTPLAGSRYWFIPALALKYELAVTAWRTAFRPATWLVAICIAYGMVIDHHGGGYPNEAFMAGVAAYDEAPPDRVVTVPIWPPGWSMAIVKR